MDRGEEEMRIEGHVTHPEHPLVYVGRGGGGESGGDFLCHGCNQPGSGGRYICYACDFVLHQHCATSPPTFSLASHDLKLVCDAHLRLGIHICDLCTADLTASSSTGSVRSATLMCTHCAVNCRQLPELMRHPSHPDHLLGLQPLSFGTCRLCETLSTAASCGYRCQLCDFNLHLPCISKSPQPNWFGFPQSPLLIVLVVTLACMVALMMMAANQRSGGGYWVHPVHYHHR